MSRARKKTTASKLVRRSPVAVSQPEPPKYTASELAVLALTRLELEDPFLLAAFIDWVKEDWKGDGSLAHVIANDGLGLQARRIEKRRENLKADALKTAAESVVRAAVMP